MRERDMEVADLTQYLAGNQSYEICIRPPGVLGKTNSGNERAMLHYSVCDFSEYSFE